MFLQKISVNDLADFVDVHFHSKKMRKNNGSKKNGRTNGFKKTLNIWREKKNVETKYRGLLHDSVQFW